MRQGQRVFIDSGAWIALALVRDPLHDRARDAWTRLTEAASRPYTSAPVVIETFTFLDRNAAREAAVAWQRSLTTVRHLKILPCAVGDLARAWTYFDRADLHKLSATDAVSFVLMTQQKIRTAFTFDSHFAAVGFRMVG